MSRLFKKGGAHTGPLSGKRVTVGSISVNVHEKIADGGFGQIYRATDNSNRQYALKSLFAPDAEHKQQIQNEYEIQKALCSHPNIVDVYGIWGDTNTLILMEFCPGALVAQMNERFSQGFDDKTIVEVFQSVTAAVEFMHRHGISHRDLKPENVLQNGGVWKLCDFGSATKVVYNTADPDERDRAAADIEKNTTALYRAPEMCDLYRGHQITTKVDVWALGCILFKLCTFKDAFDEGTNLQILNARVVWPPERHVNEKFKELVAFCFTIDPEERPTAREVLAKLQELFPSLADSKWRGEARPAGQRKKPSRQPKERVIANKEFKSEGESDDDDVPIEFLPNSLRGRNASCGALSQMAAAPERNVALSPGIQPTHSMPTFYENQAPQCPNQPFGYPQQQMPYGYQQPQMFIQEPYYQQQPFMQAPPSGFGQVSGQNSMPMPSFDPTQFGQISGQRSMPLGQQPAFAPVTPQMPQVEQASVGGGVPGSVQSSPQFEQAGFGSMPTSQVEPASNLTQASEPISMVQVQMPKETVEIDAERMTTDAEGLMRELCGSDERAMALKLECLATKKPKEFPIFVLKLIHNSGVKVNEIVKFIPKIPEKVLDELVDSRVTLQAEFPHFEGNFSVNTFVKDHGMKVGEAPFIIDSVKKLQGHLTKAIQALSVKAEEEVAAECFFCYQVTAFIMAKLKQNGVNVGFLTASSIPLLRNHHGQIKRALARLGTQPPFPREPFDFDDENFLKRIRSPGAKSFQ